MKTHRTHRDSRPLAGGGVEEVGGGGVVSGRVVRRGVKRRAEHDPEDKERLVLSLVCHRTPNPRCHLFEGSP